LESTTSAQPPEAVEGRLRDENHPEPARANSLFPLFHPILTMKENPRRAAMRIVGVSDVTSAFRG
jgi:hypothetical protein